MNSAAWMCRPVQLNVRRPCFHPAVAAVPCWRLSHAWAPSEWRLITVTAIHVRIHTSRLHDGLSDASAMTVQVYTAEEKAALAMVNFEENKRKVCTSNTQNCFGCLLMLHPALHKTLGALGQLLHSAVPPVSTKNRVLCSPCEGSDWLACYMNLHQVVWAFCLMGCTCVLG